MFKVRLKILGRRVEVPVELVAEYKKIYPPISEADFISEIEDAVKYTCRGRRSIADQEFNSIVLDVFEEAIANGKDAFNDTAFIEALIKKLKAEGEI